MFNVKKYSSLITNFFLLLFIYYGSNAVPRHLNIDSVDKESESIKQYHKIISQNQSSGLQYIISDINGPSQNYALQQTSKNYGINEPSNFFAINFNSKYTDNYYSLKLYVFRKSSC